MVPQRDHIWAVLCRAHKDATTGRHCGRDKTKENVERNYYGYAPTSLIRFLAFVFPPSLLPSLFPSFLPFLPPSLPETTSLTPPSASRKRLSTTSSTPAPSATPSAPSGEPSSKPGSWPSSGETLPQTSGNGLCRRSFVGFAVAQDDAYACLETPVVRSIASFAVAQCDQRHRASPPPSREALVQSS